MDTGLACLIAIARFHQLPAEPHQLIHEFGVPDKAFDDQQILLAGKSISFKARVICPKPAELANAALPAIAKLKDGSYLVLAKISRERPDGSESIEGPPTGYLVHDLRRGSPQALTAEEFTAQWNGTLIALTRRQGLADALQSKFDIRWFVPSLVKYRNIFYEVLIVSFFLQLFALITPLFFQVVMDKVLVHRGFTTLNVLAIGFFIVIVFEAILGGIRNYLFSHTTNRVDVELGSRLFKHLVSLPLSYFESRQVGQNVARVRELDSIRNFITGTALTLIIDLGFVFVFLGVMWYYSPQLSWIVLASVPFTCFYHCSSLRSCGIAWMRSSSTVPPTRRF